MLYKFNGEILKAEYPYLTLEGDTKKFLALYPNIILKNKDLGDLGEKNSTFTLYASSSQVKQD